MKKLIIPFLLFMYSCAEDSVKEEANAMLIDSLSTDIKEKEITINALEEDVLFSDSLNNEYALYIQKIKDNLNAINQDRKFINSAKSREFLLADSLDVVKAIEDMAFKIKENERLIESLNNSLSSAENKNNTFSKKINELNIEIATTNREVYFLKEEISQLNNSYSSLFERYNKQISVINSLEEELNKVGYVIGTKSELFKNNILTKEGGIIGIGKTKKLSNDLNTAYFNYQSKLFLNYIIVGSKNAKIMTSHPANSYRFSENEEGIIDSLIITNAEEFWKNSKYLVIEVK